MYAIQDIHPKLTLNPNLVKSRLPGACYSVTQNLRFRIPSLTIVYSTVYSGPERKQRKHQSSASLAFVRGIHRGPVNSPHKWPVTRKMFQFDDIMAPCVCVWTTFRTMTQHFPRWNFEEKYICTYIIPPNWKDTGSLILSSWMTVTEPSNLVNIMLLLSWRCKEPGHQQPWCWLISLKYFRPCAVRFNAVLIAIVYLDEVSVVLKYLKSAVRAGWKKVSIMDHSQTAEKCDRGIPRTKGR